MTEEERQETIERWAEYIIPAVFRAEDALKVKRPEWIAKLQNVTAENMKETAESYCRAVAEEIVFNSTNEEKEE
jgi:hypothetical protein